MPCRWSCLQLPRIRFDRVHVPMKGRNEAERWHLPPRIGLCPVPWHASCIPPLDHPWPRSPRLLLGRDESPGNQRLDTAKGCTPPTSTGAALTRRWRRGEGVGSMCADTGARAASSILWASRVHVFARSGSARPAPVGLHMWDGRPSCRRGFPGPTAVVLAQFAVGDVRMRAWARWR